MSVLGDWRGITSASRVYGGVGYEISDDLQRRRVEVLEKRYGGRARTHAAAALIQKAYRQYAMNKRFMQMTCPIQRIAPPMDGVPHRAMARNETQRYAPCTSLTAQLRADRSSRHLHDNDLSGLGSGRARTRSPPSPSPRKKEQQSGRSMIDSLMSPRLVSRRMPQTSSSGHAHFPGPAHMFQDGITSPRGGAMLSSSPSCSPSPCTASSEEGYLRNGNGAAATNGFAPSSQQRNGGAPIVWVPRHHTLQQSGIHCNSLGRLEKKQRTPPRDIDVDTHRTSATPRAPLTEQERKRQYRIALNFFNKKPERGVQLLMAWGFVDESADSVAKLLFGRRGLSRQMIGEYLGVLHSSFHSCVLEYFISQIDIRGLEVDVALRKTLHFFRLPGESQKIERIMQVFSSYYSRSNPQRVLQFTGGQDTVFILSYAIIMLNTDLHNKSIKQSEKMKKEQFVRNLRGVDAGGDIDKLVLAEIYDRIREEEFRPGDDHVAQVARVDQAIVGKDKPRLPDTPRRLVCYCRLNQIMDVAKKQATSAHERDVFLFNDMIMITKASGGRKRSVSSGTQQYTLKAHSPLLGAKVEKFNKGVYDFGISINCTDGQTMMFNARNHDDRSRFVADVHESILESQGMESVRLELELDRLSIRTDSQRDSGLPEMDTPEAPGQHGQRMQQQPAASRSFRRLSFNSLDSGVVEEGFDVQA